MFVAGERRHLGRTLTTTALAGAILVLAWNEQGSAQQPIFDIEWPNRQPKFMDLEAGGWVPPIEIAQEPARETHKVWFDPAPMGSLQSASASFSLSDQPSTTGSTTAPATCPEPAPAVASSGPIEQPPQTSDSERGKFIGRGRAVWYELPGKTASGETFDPDGLTAGHRTLPFGAKVRVVNESNGRSVVVRINDRGPVQRKFVIDLSRGSAKSIGISGTSTVSLYLLENVAEARTRQSAR